MSLPTEASCPLCRSSGPFAFRKDDHDHHRCRECGTLFVVPVPEAEALAAWYRTALADKNSALCWEGTERHAVAAWRRMLAAAERLGGRGPLLDVGCGAGQFLEFARASGWVDLAGLELSPEAARAARERSGAVVHEAPLATAAVPEARYAVVTLWDVLEHLAAPRDALRRVLSFLRPGGVAIVGTPNARGVTTRRFGKDSLVLMPPEHLFVATRRGLRGAATAAGLEVVSVEAIDVRIRDWLGAASSPAGEAKGRYQDVYARLTASRLFGAAQAAANALLRGAGLGDQLLMIARRPASPHGNTA